MSIVIRLGARFILAIATCAHVAPGFLDAQTAPPLTREQQEMLRQLDEHERTARTRLLQEDYAGAIKAMRQAVPLAEKIFGEKDWQTINVRLDLDQIERLSKMKPAERAETVDATRLMNQARAQFQQKNVTDAFSNVRRALEIRKRLLGDDHRHTAECYMFLGHFYEATESLKKASESFEHRLAILTKVCTEAHPATARAHNDLGDVLHLQDAYAAARPHYEKALPVFRTALGETHPDTVLLRNSYGLVLSSLHEYAEAIPHIEFAMAAYKKMKGKQHPDTANVLFNLGSAQQKQGHYVEALAAHLEALDIRIAILGEFHVDTGKSLDSVGMLHLAQGDLAAAKPYLVRSVAVFKRVRGDDHFETATALTDLGTLLQYQGDLAEARRCFEQALRVFRQTRGEGHPDTLTCRNNLGNLTLLQGLHAESLEHLDAVLRAFQKTYGENHLFTAKVRNNLGNLHFMKGDHATARAHLEKALEVTRKIAGEEHQETTFPLSNLVFLHQLTGEKERAFQLALRLLAIEQRELRNLLELSSENAMYAPLMQANDSHRVLLSMTIEAKEKGDATEALTWTLRRKGVVFDSLLRFHQLKHQVAADDPINAQLRQHRDLRHRLNETAMNPPPDWSPEKLLKQRLAWQKEAEALEAEIHRSLRKRFGPAFEDFHSVDTPRVREKLKAGEALIEFVRLNPFPFNAIAEARGKEKNQEPRYLAFVLIADRQAPKLFDLGEAKAIDGAVLQLREHLERAPDPTVSIKAYWPEAKKVHQLVFAPLRKELGEAQTIYLAADGLLNQVPFEALVDEQGKFLIENYRFAYQTSGRDLLRPAPPSTKGVAVFAGPDFDLDANKRKEQVQRLGTKPKSTPIALRGPLALETRGANWKALKGATAEANDLRQSNAGDAFGPLTSYEGPEALEEMLKGLPAPRILHIATHGYYFDREPGPANEALRAHMSFTARLRKIDNPLLRSGLVLAGANTIGEKKSVPGIDDGWVTAEEIGLLNLRGAELVVLSACQTGLGDVKTGEGVYGLRRAFLHAGARTLLTSLFSVPDKETRVLMNRFYSRLKSGQSKLDALRGAQREIIQERQRQQGEPLHPFYWSAFVLVGDPR